VKEVQLFKKWFKILVLCTDMRNEETYKRFIIMRRLLIISFIGTGIAFLLIIFTNCDVYSENNLFAEVDMNCIDTGDCDEKSSEYLELRINSLNNFPLKSDQTTFDIGGECNEGGYSRNEIIWELYRTDGSGPIRNSSTYSLNGTCINGRFSIQVKLSNPTLEENSGTGNRAAHRLYVEIVGIDGNKRFKNSLLGRKSIVLIPVENNQQQQ